MKTLLEQSLIKKKQQVLKKWQGTAFSSQRITTGGKPEGRFSDPVSYVVKANTEAMLEWLLEDQGDLRVPLEEICRLKAVEETRPAEALGFIFALKQIISEELAGDHEIEIGAEELWKLDKRIDEMGLLAFDIYYDCRAKIYELRINEIKRLNGRGAG